MVKRIRVEEDTHAALASLKGDDESFDDLLTRLLREHRGGPQSGAGLWEGSDAPEHARETRRELKSGIDTRDPES
ncbi:antitoxin VapB family protein [Halorubrum sp. CBA1229]|jgi:predicted CopG family antitoxin|uniref:antitoxin VapB family protein n=1 Tax=Halorubrum sp. CBA1229 TaxID=1853699 RepID=UPI000F3DAA6D|nr:antitoxin VapB family protein [Halorubrum sp. CBA1229]QKY16799.1 hypothetical protein Hrr1229_007855 [Halorubrum sp. CBA1229]